VDEFSIFKDSVLKIQKRDHMIDSPILNKNGFQQKKIRRITVAALSLFLCLTGLLLLSGLFEVCLAQTPSSQTSLNQTPSAQNKPKTASAIEPLILTLKSTKDIYRKREGVQVTFLLKAQEPIRLCLEKDPLTQFQFTAYRGGKGVLSLEPYVAKDTRELYFEKMRIIDLKPGQAFPYRANIKKLVPANGEKWIPGDYSLGATFNLCDQTQAFRNDSAGKDMPIKGKNLARFMITD
jgi:hypothetical protein